MGPSVDLQVWAGRFCLSVMGVLTLMGFYFANVRFVPVAAGFAILAGVFYFTRLHSAAPTRAPAVSGSHRALEI